MSAPFTALPAAVLSVLLTSCGANPLPEALPGIVERDRLELIAESNEPILELPVREGERVTAGTTLVVQGRGLVDTELARLEAEIEAAHQRLLQLERGTRPEDLAAARARLASTEAELANADRELRRLEGLVPEGAVSRAAVDRQRAARDAARGARDAAAAALTALRRGPRIEEIEAARSALAAARARRASAQVSAGRATIAAPRPGRLEALPYRVGERPSPGAVLAILEAEDRPAWIRLYVPAPVREPLMRAARIEVRADGVVQPFTGRLRYISSEAAFTPYYSLTPDDRSRLAYLAEIELPPDAQVPVGIGATITWSGAAGGS